MPPEKGRKSCEIMRQKKYKIDHCEMHKGMHHEKIDLIFFFFLTEMNTFRQWVQYRYGTFSEMGYDWDPLYPSLYHAGPLEKVSTGCSNLTLDEQMSDASILRNKVS